MTIQTSPFDNGKRIRIDFPYDPALVAAVKRIPGAKFDGKTRSWNVATRYRAQVEVLGQVGQDADAAYEAMVTARMKEVRNAALPGSNVYFAFKRREIEVGDPSANFIRDLPGARWDKIQKRFVIYASTPDQIDRIVARLRAGAEGLRQRNAEYAAAKAEANAAAVKEGAEKVARDEAEGRGRYGSLYYRAPIDGTVLRLGDRIVTTTGTSKSWRIGEDDSSLGCGTEGEKACYVYYRAATEAEAADFEAKETAAKEQAAKVRDRRAAIAIVASSTDAPHLGHEPEGEVIWKDDSSALVGSRSWIVLTPEGWLWHLDYDGTDGGTWIDKNCGYCTAGRRVPATDDLVERIRG